MQGPWAEGALTEFISRHLPHERVPTLETESDVARFFNASSTQPRAVLCTADGSWSQPEVPVLTALHLKLGERVLLANAPASHPGGHALCRAAARSLPAFLFFSSPDAAPKKYQGAITAAGVSKFLRQRLAVAAAAAPEPGSCGAEPLWYHARGPAAKRFPQATVGNLSRVLATDLPVFLCVLRAGHLRAFTLPAACAKAAAALRGIARFAWVDAGRSPDLGQVLDFRAKGPAPLAAPVARAYGFGRASKQMPPLWYDSAADPASIERFVRGLVPNTVPSLNRTTLPPFLGVAPPDGAADAEEDSEPAQEMLRFRGVGPAEGGEEGLEDVPRVLLLAAGNHPPLWYRALAARYAHEMPFGFVSRRHKEVVDALGVARLPALLVLEAERSGGAAVGAREGDGEGDGDEDEDEKYDEEEEEEGLCEGGFCRPSRSLGRMHVSIRPYVGPISGPALARFFRNVTGAMGASSSHRSSSTRQLGPRRVQEASSWTEARRACTSTGGGVCVVALASEEDAEATRAIAACLRSGLHSGGGLPDDLRRLAAFRWCMRQAAACRRAAGAGTSLGACVQAAAASAEASGGEEGGEGGDSAAAAVLSAHGEHAGPSVCDMPPSWVAASLAQRRHVGAACARMRRVLPLGAFEAASAHSGGTAVTYVWMDTHAACLSPESQGAPHCEERDGLRGAIVPATGSPGAWEPAQGAEGSRGSPTPSSPNRDPAQSSWPTARRPAASRSCGERPRLKASGARAPP